MEGRCNIVLVEIVFLDHVCGKFLRVLLILILKLVEMILKFYILLLEGKLVFVIVWVCFGHDLLVWFVLMITVFNTEIRVYILGVVGQYLGAVAGVVLSSVLV